MHFLLKGKVLRIRVEAALKMNHLLEATKIFNFPHSASMSSTNTQRPLPLPLKGWVDRSLLKGQAAQQK